MIAEFDHVVSLGGNCRLTHHLRRHFGFDSAYPFDWWGTSLATVAALLAEPRLDVVFDPGRLEAVMRDGRRATVRNTFYDIYFRHEFASVGGEVALDYLDGAAAALDRQRYLFRKLDGLDRPGNRLLLVRSFVEQDEHLNRREVDDFLAAVKAKFAKARVSILLINPPQDHVYPPEIMVLRFLDEARPDWRGGAGTWDRHLASLGVGYAGARWSGPFEAAILPPALTPAKAMAAE